MLRPFTKADFNMISRWVTSEGSLLQFVATTFPYTLKYTDMLAYAMNECKATYNKAIGAELYVFDR